MSQTHSTMASQITGKAGELDKRVVRLAGLAGISAIVLASRIPFTSKVLYHWDSVNFAYAIQEFNLAKEQPQPPGYILYVWLCQLLNSFMHDPNAVMIAISIASSVGAVLAMFFLGEALYNERVGWLSAGFLAASPLFWFYNEIALPHTLDAFLVISSVYFLYKTMQGERQYVFPAVILLAIAGGVRQQTLVFLAPLLLFAFRKIGWKRFVAAGFVGVVVCLLWFIPLIIMSGGLSQYMAVMNEFSDRFQKTTSIFMGAGLWGVKRNVTKLILYSAYGWGIFFIPFIVQAARKVLKVRFTTPSARSIFIGLWILPAVLFYLLIHMGQQGLVFVFLPALLLLGASAFDSIVQGRVGYFAAGGLILMLLSSAVFLLLPEYPFGAGGQRLLTRQTLVNSDQYFIQRFDAIRQSYKPQSTLILAENWHHVQYYLPDYKVIPFNLGAKWEVDEGAPDNNASVVGKGSSVAWGLQPSDAQVVIFDPPLFSYAGTQDQTQLVGLPSGSDSMATIHLPSGALFYVNADSFGVEAK